MAFQNDRRYVCHMQITLSARGGKAPAMGLTQVVEGADEALTRHRQLDMLFDGTATILMSDANGALLTLEDLYRMQGLS